jgi:hypothetical protein
VPAIVPLALAAGVTLMFNYTPMAMTAIGRPYLSALPILIMVLTRIGCGVLLFNGSLNSFAWALLLATLASAPVTAVQQKRYFGFGIATLLWAMVPSALVAIGTGAAAMLLAMLLPQGLASLVRLLIMALPLAAIWYVLLRATRHELVGEVHRLAAPITARLALLRPNV